MTEVGEPANPPCPRLPLPDRPLTAADSRALGKERGAPFYSMCLHYAQSKWMAGLPAQALLQLNRAMAADLQGDEAVLDDCPIPFAAVAWILGEAGSKEGQFLGNPRRHWQHYATRMSGPRAELRTWRAWACWDVAGLILPPADFPVDGLQVSEEGIVLPERPEIGRQLEQLGLPGERAVWESVIQAIKT